MLAEPALDGLFPPNGLSFLEAVNTTCPMLSSYAGVGPCQCTGPPVDHCDIPLPRVATMKGHVDVFLMVEMALDQAVAQILEPCGH
jgi:hypothetical protein